MKFKYSADSWSSKINLSEIEFWFENVWVLNGMFIWPTDELLPMWLQLVLQLYNEISQGAWSPVWNYSGCLVTFLNYFLSSAWKEIMAIYRALCMWSVQFKDHRIKWFTDSKNTERAFLHGCMTNWNIHFWPMLFFEGLPYNSYRK